MASRSSAQILEEAGHGRLLNELRLNGEVEVGGGRTSVALCLGEGGLWLVGGATAEPVVLDLLVAGRRLRYHSAVLGDRLEVDDWRLGIPRGRADQALEMLALGRLAAGAGRRRAQVAYARAQTGPWSWDGPLVDELSARERAWLRAWFEDGERLLVWLRSSEDHMFTSPILSGGRGSLNLVISQHKAALIALSSVGEVYVESLPVAPLKVVEQLGRDHVEIGDRTLRSSLGNAGRWAALERLPALPEVERMLAHASVMWRHASARKDPVMIARVRALLDRLSERSPLAVLASELIVDAAPLAEDGSVVPLASASPAIAALKLLSVRPGAGESLLAWAETWELRAGFGELLVEHLCELGQGGALVALPLHEHVRPRLHDAVGDDPESAALIDFVLVEHLLVLERPQRALEILHERRATLPRQDLRDLLPARPGQTDQRIRIELHEAIAQAHALLVDGHVEALAELVQLQPLVVDRLLILIESLRVLPDDDRFRAALPRAGAVLGLLDEQLARELGLGAPEGLGSGRPRALSGEQIELHLRHPAAREDGVLGRMQGALAKIAVPDCSALKAYCERANLAREAALAHALADASVMLGVGSLELFVSRGDKSVGLRAYDGDTPFVLIGGDHLDPESDAFLPPSALCFAVAAELAHLSFKHSRVTNDEVWAGTLDLGLTGLGVLVGALPAIGGWVSAPAGRVLDKLGSPALERWRKRVRDGAAGGTLTSDNSELIAAHRVMQLTADRAGLIACRDPGAAVRAIFAVHPRYLSQWPVVERHGLLTALTRLAQSDDERERLRGEDLAVRVAALMAFYLSDDYAALVSD